MPKGRKKADSLSPRKAQFVKGVVAGKSARQAALDAGYSQSVANDPGRKLFNQSDIQSVLGEHIRKIIPAERIAQRMSEGLDAMETVFAKFEGRISDKTEVVSWSERRQYAELAAKMGGYMPKDTPDLVVPIQVVIDL
jgi:phage terminase small subunit